jgi:hypothetical protein
MCQRSLAEKMPTACFCLFLPKLRHPLADGFVADGCSAIGQDSTDSSLYKKPENGVQAIMIKDGWANGRSIPPCGRGKARQAIKNLLKREVAVALLAATLAGCMAPLTLDDMVVSYNEAVIDSISKQLLFNIARARHHQPLHFTGVSNIAATLNFQFTVGATPALTGSSGGLMMPIFGGSASENPTISIIPIDGEEFTKRLLTPIQENKLTFLLRQGADIDKILRLMAVEFREFKEGVEVAYYNLPSDKAGYPIFRRILLHLSSVQDRRQLYVDPLTIEKTWTLPAKNITAEGFRTLQQEFDIEYRPDTETYRLTKNVVGRVIITNYHPDLLSNQDRIRLNDKAAKGHDNEIMVDIRPDYPGGEYPIHGTFRLRSLQSILAFIGKSIADEPEYNVEKDPRTPVVSENPVSSLGIVESESPPDTDMQVKVNGYHYSLLPEAEGQWNRDGFRLLYSLFQMTVTEMPQRSGPSITIAK